MKLGVWSLNRKLRIGIDACWPGMVIAETIYNNYGAIIVWENKMLDETAISRLKIFGINSVLVYQSSLKDNINVTSGKQDAQKKAEQIPFAVSYEKDKDELKSILHDLSTGKTVSLIKTADIAQSIYNRKNDSSEIIDCISQLRRTDEYTYYHCINVSLLSMLTGRWLKLSAEDQYMLAQAGIMHDIGKCLIPPEIINKPAKLTNEEFKEVKKHPEFGYFMIRNLGVIDDRVSEAVYYHHEREDGSGYPRGIKSAQIPLFAKIVAISDTFDAMTANRPYKPKDSPFLVFELMQNGCFGYLDPVVLNAFLSNISPYYIGYKVRLSDKRIAEVVYINKQQYGKPVLKVDDTYLDLSVAKNIAIEEVL